MWMGSDKLEIRSGGVILLIRLLLLFFVGLMVRRLFKATFGRGQRSTEPKNPDGKPGETGESGANYTDLTEQGIDDADFEEIP